MTALAEELGGWGRLNGHEAADTVQWTRRIRNQLALRLPISSDAPHHWVGNRPAGALGHRDHCLNSGAINPLWRLQQGRLPLVRDRKHSHDYPRIWREQVELLSRSEKEMQVALTKFVKVFRLDLRKSGSFIAFTPA